MSSRDITFAVELGADAVIDVKYGKEERFEVIFRDGSSLKDEGIRQILVDKKTGVNYLCWNSGFGASITPLLDSEGKVIVTK